MKHKPRTPYTLFAETKVGIVTRFGDWFHTTSEQIEEFVPGLLQRVELEELVRGAQAWVKSADSIGMVLLLLMLVIFDPLLASGLALIFHFGWYLNKSSMVVISLNKILELLYKDGTQLLISLVAISYLGLTGDFLAAGLGLFFFFMFKLSLLRRLWDKIYNSYMNPALSLNDRVMKMVIIRYAIYEDVAPEEVREMEAQIKELAMTGRKKN